jgi:putative ABC transport system permease protein
MGILIADLRIALRRLVKSPGLALAAMFMLALGIGANTAIYNGLYAVLFRPLPFQYINVTLWGDSAFSKEK